MSGRRMKAARAAARKLERQTDRDARVFCRVPWYIRPFPRWRRRWFERWEREHLVTLRRTTKRMAHEIADGDLARAIAFAGGNMGAPTFLAAPKKTLRLIARELKSRL